MHNRIYANIIQWNIRGYRANYYDLRHLLSDTQSVCACLQETMIGDGAITTPRGYVMHSAPGGRGERPHGGVAILLRNDVSGHKIPIRSDLQVLAIRVRFDKMITICNIYLPPNDLVTAEQIMEVIDQLPPPFILVGDFNARHRLWGDVIVNNKGKMIEKILTETPINILNNDHPTHFHTQTDSLSNIDLSLCTPDLTMELSWEVGQDLYGSDHFPILIKRNIPQATHRNPRFLYKKADWTQFQMLTVPELNVHDLPEIDDAVSYITDLMITSAKTSIPMTKGGEMTRRVPWWSEEVEKAIRERKAATKKYYRTKLVQDKINFKRLRAVARRTILEAKRKSWQDYISTINSRTPMSKIWKKIGKISGQYKPHPLPILSQNDQLITDPVEVGNAFGRSLYEISKGSNDPIFQNRKRITEQRAVNFQSNEEEVYNKTFTMCEIREAIGQCKDTAPGEDGISNQMIKHLPAEALTYILALYNRIWTEEEFPLKWKSAIVIPIAKEGKDGKDVKNYRPIALTSCLCKLLERIVNNRLTWTLESQQILCQHQYGFRKNRSTTEVLVKLDTAIKKAFCNKQHCISIFFDMQKAYDTTWRRGILNVLYQAGFRGHLPIFIRNFLTERRMKVRVGSVLSDSFEQVEGVPQGSVLSVTCFALAINQLPSCIPQGTECTLYVDDFSIYGVSAYLPALERRMQLALKSVVKWSLEHGFTISKEKTVAMHFTKLRGVFPEPELKIDNTRLKVVQETRFLGLVLDPKLSYIPHLRSLREKAMKAMNVMKSVSHLAWGAERDTLLTLYRALIRSKIDYGCQIYASANKTSLKMLDAVHHLGIRLSIGAFRSSPVDSLYIESGEPSLYLRRDKLSLQLYARLMAMEGSPAYISVKDTSIDDKLRRNRRMHNTFGYRIRNLFTSLQFEEMTVAENDQYDTAFWIVPEVDRCESVTTWTKSLTPADILRKIHNSHCRASHINDVAIYTDGSKSLNGVGCAAVFPNRIISHRLPKHCSIFTAELQAILTALSNISLCNEVNFTVFCDSRSVMDIISDIRPNNYIVLEIHRLSVELCRAGKNIKYCWVPSHIGIYGNEKADVAAKAAINDPEIQRIPLPCRDYYPVIREILMKNWQIEWETRTNNKLFETKKTVSPWKTASSLDRRRDVILTRLRIGHTKLTHGFLMEGGERPYCDECIVPRTIKHILCECPNYAAQRATYLGNAGIAQPLLLKEVLKDEISPSENLIKFLNNTGIAGMI